MKKHKNLLVITLGSIVVALGVYFFHMPNNLVVGGVTGLAIGLNHFVPFLSTGLVLFILNLILFALGFLLLGRTFGALTIYSALLISFLIRGLEYIFPNQPPLTDNILLNMIVGILIVGAGLAVVINSGASTGGTDIVAMIFKKYFNLEIGKGLFVADFFTILVGGFAFGIEILMLGFLGILLNSLVVDKAIAGFNTKVNLFIVSRYPYEINDYIINDLRRGSSIYHAQGGYTLEERHIINTVVTQRQYIRLKNKVEEIDPKAFISMSYISEVLGEGFTYELEREEIS